MPKTANEVEIKLTEEQAIGKMEDSFRIGYSHHTAESSAIDEGMRIAVEYDLDRDVVYNALRKVGYKKSTADQYISKLNAVKADEKASEEVIQREVSFDKAARRAVKNRRERNPNLVAAILYAAYDEAARLAKRYGQSLEQHLEFSKAAYNRQNQN